MKLWNKARAMWGFIVMVKRLWVDGLHCICTNTHVAMNKRAKYSAQIGWYEWVRLDWFKAIAGGLFCCGCYGCYAIATLCGQRYSITAPQPSSLPGAFPLAGAGVWGNERLHKQGSGRQKKGPSSGSDLTALGLRRKHGVWWVALAGWLYYSEIAMSRKKCGRTE